MYGSSNNSGNQQITWKYYTPLQGDYLNNILGGIATPGLLSRPNFMLDTGNQSISVGPFTCLLIPNDDNNKVSGAPDNTGNTYVSGNRNYPVKLIKVTVTSSSGTDPQPIANNTIAIGISFSFNAGANSPRNWYASIDCLTTSDIADYKGIIIGTVQRISRNGDTDIGWSVTTSGADISNILLQEEGWNPRCWLSLISPRRAETDSEGKIIYNQFEVRGTNDDSLTDSLRYGCNNSYGGYLAGSNGIIKGSAENTRYKLPLTIPTEERNLNGVRGFMDNDFTLFAFNTNRGLFASQGHNGTTFDPSVFINVDGGILGYTNAQKQNIIKNASSEQQFAGSLGFTNKVLIKPIQMESQIVSYYDAETETLYIK